MKQSGCVRRRGWLALEFSALYIGLPMAVTFLAAGRPVLPFLWLAAAMCFAALRRIPRPDRENTPSDIAGWPAARRIGLRWLAGVAVLAGLLLWVYPGLWLALPSRRPGLWAIVMVAYPLASVFPQGIVYRVFLYRRYRFLFGEGPVLSFVAALVFALSHAVFLNPWAIGFTLVGGWMFFRTYLRYGVSVYADVEHALYGCALFTMGWGALFFHGTAGTVSAALEVLPR